VRRNVPWLFSKTGNRQFFRAHWEVMEVEKLVALAREGDQDALDILKEYARGARKAGMIVPDDLHAFVWEYFIDGPPKAKSGSSSKDSELRFQTIALLVKKVSQDFGFPEYRNPEHRGRKDGPMSACKLVAEELGLSERTVEEIWGERKIGVIRSA
jgi:hypothetical protein